VLSNDNVSEIVRRANADRNEYDRRQAQLDAKKRAQELQFQKAIAIRKQREIEERKNREHKKRESYRSIIASRGIKELIHFTNISNVETIVKYGILPRNILEKKLPAALINDINRYDNFRNAACLSVSFPNYKMFYKYQVEDSDARWAVLSLSPDLLADFNIKYFYFFKENAAKNDSSRCSFNEMFGNSSGCDPENPQAEILAFGVIPSKYIRKIYVRTSEDKVFLERKIGGRVNIELNTRYFKYRTGDYV